MSDFDNFVIFMKKGSIDNIVNVLEHDPKRVNMQDSKVILVVVIHLLHLYTVCNNDVGSNIVLGTHQYVTFQIFKIAVIHQLNLCTATLS
jgi:hypothetical protein